jgi:hypothetical protein
MTVENFDSLLDIEVPGDADVDGGLPTDDAQPVAGKPEWLTDDLWDAENNSPIVDKLLDKLQKTDKQAKDLREKLGRRGAPPENYEEYKVDSEGAEWAELVTDDDEVLTEAKKMAQKLGLTQGQFAPLARIVMDSMYKQATAAGEEVPAELSEEEKASLIKAEHAKIGPNAPAVLKAVSEWVKTIEAQGVLSRDDVVTLKDMCVTGEQVRVLNKLRSLSGGAPVPMAIVDGVSIQGLPSDQEISDFFRSAEFQSGDKAAHARYHKWMAMRKEAGRPPTLQTRW